MRELTQAQTNCTATTGAGRFCDRPSLPEAPFPICLRHATGVLEYLNDRVNDSGSAARVVKLIDAVEKTDIVAPQPLVPTWHKQPVVYYLLVSGYIKIGYTANLAERLRAYPPNTELLAFETGLKTLESKRLKEFRRYKRAGLEWFEPGPLLMAHIQTLRAAPAAA